jgi:serine/threonine protein kinase/tetratricopeptide (TPR) repeat protein
MMTPERWKEIKAVLGQALELEPSQRAAYMDQAGAKDPSLRAEVDRLLAADQNAGDFFCETMTQLVAGPESGVGIPSRIGQRIGAYKIVEAIGEGGMGTVYRAVRDDAQYKKEVAIKLIHTGQDSAFILSRFRNERQILASLDHPNIARLLDGGTTDDGAPYFVMELIEGQAVDEYCDHRRLSTRDRLRVFLQICAAVQFAHQRLVIHRDIKPGNILVGADGAPKLLDFGIAKLLDTAAGGEDATMTVFRALTPGYASPEQIKGEPITTASDVYSLGVVLYELMTGRSPYKVTSRAPHELARAVCETEPERPSTVMAKGIVEGETFLPETSASAKAVRRGSAGKLRRDLRGDLDNIVLMALRKEPERRYPSVEQFAEDIRRHLSNLPVVASKSTISYRTGKFVSRHKAGVLAAVIVGLTVIAGIVATLREARIARQQAAIAQTERARAQSRFDDVRKLANSLIFEVHDSIVNLPGSTPARKLIMERAVEYLDSLAKDATGDVGLQRDLAWAYHRIGQVQGDSSQGNVGQHDAMLTSMNKAVSLFEHVAKANPNSPIDQLNAAFAHRLLGTLAPQPGERRDQIEQAMSITGALLKSNPDNPKIKSERAIEFTVLAQLQDADGEISGAVESFRASVALRTNLIAANPDYPGAKIGLATAQTQSAIELAQGGWRKEALELNAEGISLFESVVAKEKNNARASRGLSASLYNRGEILMANEDYNEALENYQKALVLVKPLALQDPQNTMLSIDLAGNTINVGKALFAMGRTRQGLPMIEQGIRVLDQQAKTNPSDAAEPTAASYVWQGDAWMELGRVQDAIASYRKAISLWESQLAEAPESPSQCRLANTYTKLGNALTKTDNSKEASAAYEKALGIVEPMKLHDAPTLRAAYVLADTYFGLGNLAKKAAENPHSDRTERIGQWQQARSWYLKSHQAWQQIPRPGFLNPEGFRCGNRNLANSALAEVEASLNRIQ